MESFTINAVVEDGGSAVDQTFLNDGHKVVSVGQGEKILPNTVVWKGPNNVTGKTEDVIEISRTYPKPNGAFYGVMRPSVKRSKSVTVELSDGTTRVVPANIRITGSIPVGLSVNDRVCLVNQLIALAQKTFFSDILADCQIENFS
jgi:hypothetical protein